MEHQDEPSEKIARRYFQQLVDGLHYCHRRGIFHRKLGPESLLINQEDTLRITGFEEFSISLQFNLRNLLRCRSKTPYFCPPEFFRTEENSYSAPKFEKIDAWSCGIILYRLLTGVLPFRSDNADQLYLQIQECNLEYPSEISRDARDLLRRLLTKDPSTRYDLSDVKSHRWFLTGYEGGTSHGASVTSGSSSLSADHGQNLVHHIEGQRRLIPE